MGDSTLFVIRLTQQREFTNEIIGAHVEHLRRLDDDGRLVLAGPLSGEPPGGLIVIRADSEQEARSVAEADPFVREGFEGYELRSLTRACRENGYLLG
jgi:uncharacterized protein YciI